MYLRDYQAAAVDALFDYFRSHKQGNPLVAMPTGTGKSLVIAEFARHVVSTWPDQRVVMLTHVKELIQQNAEKLLAMWPTAPLGIYSAGLGRRDIAPITYAGIGSVHTKAAALGRVDLVLIDEAHLVGTRDSAMYVKLLGALALCNPALRVIGFTATPYRSGLGMLTDGGLFTDVAYDITGREAFNTLIARGYLAPLVPKRTGLQVDISSVRTVAHDYNVGDLQDVMDKEHITRQALHECCQHASDRDCWLVFTTGVEHTCHVADMLNDEFGITARAVHSKMSDEDRDAAIADHKAGRVQCLVNNNVLTTGFDNPRINFIGVLRHTQSAGLWVQMLGRGTRPSPGKTDCLVLDFANNTARLGPINDPVLPRKPGEKKGPGVAPVRVCDACMAYNHASATHCAHCGEEFKRDVKFNETASTAALLAGAQPTVETFRVDRVTYAVHRKPDKPPTLKVSYHCGFRLFSEWLAFEHPGFAGRKARAWWRKRYPYEGAPPSWQGWTPDSIEEAVRHAPTLRVPPRVLVRVDTKNPEIQGYEYDEHGPPDRD